jgi:SMC interacting uncharacterized protein involved in chromosome segregation
MANEQNNPMDRDATGSRPVPDPTVLTTEALHREINSSYALTTAKIESLEKVMLQKFSAVEEQLQLVERQRVEQKKDTKDAVDAALTAQKEAVREQTTASERAIAKSEAATTKQMDQQRLTFETAIKSVTDLMNEVKERITRIESVKIGWSEQSTNVKQNLGVVWGAVGAVVGLIGVVIAFATVLGGK